ncbi:hypothetical protein GCD22_01851 [Acidithiobacillus thiooxidans ATCC 19377]|uniref:Uncharacterized protein n=1 Tax=Acidithiobacillus thiooxidans ATCC 19377 TaxID=637390 RepID=A0A5P9XQS0_ACITH|nr:hypothetical protein GCD22_01851 [Acidithiobacillus thiooxidans ATCC 19377]
MVPERNAAYRTHKAAVLAFFVRSRPGCGINLIPARCENRFLTVYFCVALEMAN